jgi:hypothetical protein
MRRPGVIGSFASMIFIIGALAAACAFDPVQPSRDPSARPPSPSGGPPESEVPTLLPPPSTTRPSAPGFSEYVATSCNGRPSANQVIAVVRPKLNLGANVQITVTRQPTCAGTWQYTVLSVPEHEPVHAVTRGDPAALTVVAAGSNPCIPAVRVSAPSGLRSVLGCDAVTTTTTTTTTTATTTSTTGT